MAIDAAGDAVIADIGVYAVGEVDHRGALGQLHDVAFWGEHVDIVGEQVVFDVFDKLQRIPRVALHLQQPFHPGTGAGMAAFSNRMRRLPGFVEPVRGNSVIGHGFHFTGADLHLDGHAALAKQRGVQTLVTIRLGNRDVVFKAPRYRLIEVMHDAKDAITAGHVFGDNAKTEDIHNLGKRLALVAHLFINREQMFLAANHRAF